MPDYPILNYDSLPRLVVGGGKEVALAENLDGREAAWMLGLVRQELGLMGRNADASLPGH